MRCHMIQNVQTVLNYLHRKRVSDLLVLSDQYQCSTSCTLTLVQALHFLQKISKIIYIAFYFLISIEIKVKFIKLQINVIFCFLFFFCKWPSADFLCYLCVVRHAELAALTSASLLSLGCTSLLKHPARNQFM